MKNSGLSNRFSNREVWMFWHTCMWCGKGGFDSLHHIISPSSQHYHKGKFNSSILNSSPMHNCECHLDNPHLHKLKYERLLLEKTFKALANINYGLTSNDREFYRIYHATHYRGDKVGRGLWN